MDERDYGDEDRTAAQEPYWQDAQDIAEERCGNDCDCRRIDPPETWCAKHDDWRTEESDA